LGGAYNSDNRCHHRDPVWINSNPRGNRTALEVTLNRKYWSKIIGYVLVAASWKACNPKAAAVNGTAHRIM
jgi:hypothetical protein